jgi:hypothetical protein
MNKVLKVVIVVVAVLGFASFVVWRTQVAAKIKLPLYGIVADITSSHSGSRESACLTVAGIAERLVQQSTDTPGSLMEVLALGDSSRGGEPLKLSSQEQMPARTALSTGKAAIVRQQHAYVVKIYENCVKATAPEYSAIHLGIERMLEYARSKKCGSDSRCVVYVDTDGNENVEPSLKAKLQGLPLSRHESVVLLDNSGVDVRFCGLAERTVDVAERKGLGGRREAFRSHKNPTHMEDVWRSFFTHPDQVSFEPYCSEATNPNDYLKHQVELSHR